MTLTLHKDLTATAFGKNGQPVTVIDEFERAFEGYSLDLIEEACECVIDKEQFFPNVDTLKDYYRGVRPALEPVLALPEPEPTPDDRRRRKIVGFWMLRNIYEANPVESERLLQDTTGPGWEGRLDAFVEEHWNSDIGKMHEQRRASKAGRDLRGNHGFSPMGDILGHLDYSSSILTQPEETNHDKR